MELADTLTATLRPLVQPGALEGLRLIAESGSDGISRGELEDQRIGPLVETFLSPLITAGVAERKTDLEDRRRTRYVVGRNATAMLEIGSSLERWASAVTGDPDPFGQTLGRKLLRSASTLCRSGILYRIRDGEATIPSLVAEFGGDEFSIRRKVDAATNLGLLVKRPVVNHSRRILPSPALVRLLRPVALTYLELNKPQSRVEVPPLSRVQLSIALRLLAARIAPIRQLRVPVRLAVEGDSAKPIVLIARFEAGRVVSTSRSGDYGAEITASLRGWLRFVGRADTDAVEHSGWGARSALEGINGFLSGRSEAR